MSIIPQHQVRNLDYDMSLGDAKEAFDDEPTLYNAARYLCIVVDQYEEGLLPESQLIEACREVADFIAGLRQ